MSMTLGYWDIRGLPYLIDGTHRITQSNAIMRYIARKHNLCGETEEEKIRVDILENQAMDVSNQLARVCYSPDFEKLKPEYLEGLPTMMQHFSQFLGKRPWFVGDKVMGACDGDTRDLSYILCYGDSSPHILGLLQISFVDFLAYDVLDLHCIFEPKCLDAFPNLKDFISRFEGLEKISAYMKSSRFLPKPLYTRVAVWGNK
ncbi:glutathione S-transferase Mu 4 isoform X4 [Trachypithecus francoisi]|uniref:glutathione S-transferase Mu 4 isoform X4 n=1 Tax=Trachypithecus francoisi TaxID=54180 RepID=UPI00141A6D30|nr:glutathione S-transferase Mu 4 isoform X4 [Trachypithecus francoisi]